MHKATNRFWDCFDELPVVAQNTARKNFELLKQNSAHPSLHFKKVGRFWSARARRNYRALAFYDGEDFIWVWIGAHDKYELMLK